MLRLVRVVGNAAVGGTGGYLSPGPDLLTGLVIEQGSPILPKEQNLLQQIQNQLRAVTLRETVGSGLGLPLAAAHTSLAARTEDGAVAVPSGSERTDHTNYLEMGLLAASVQGVVFPVYSPGAAGLRHLPLWVPAPPSTATARTDVVLLEFGFREIAPIDLGEGGVSEQLVSRGYVGPGRVDVASSPDNALLDSFYGSESSRRVQLQFLPAASPGVTYLEGGGPGDVDPASVVATALDGTVTELTFIQDPEDPHLWRAGSGSEADAALLNTVDGYVWAIPLFTVVRRNTVAYNAGTNPSGGGLYPDLNGRDDDLYADIVDLADLYDLRPDRGLYLSVTAHDLDPGAHGGHFNYPNNPHGVTAAMVGADPAGTAAGLVGDHNDDSGAHEAAGFELVAHKDVADGYPGLDADGLLGTGKMVAARVAVTPILAYGSTPANVQAYLAAVPGLGGGGGGGAVTSWKTRIGDVDPAAHDYTAAQVDLAAVAALAGITDVQAAIEALAAYLHGAEYWDLAVNLVAGDGTDWYVGVNYSGPLFGVKRAKADGRVAKVDAFYGLNRVDFWMNAGADVTTALNRSARYELVYQVYKTTMEASNRIVDLTASIDYRVGTMSGGSHTLYGARIASTLADDGTHEFASGDLLFSVLGIRRNAAGVSANSWSPANAHSSSDVALLVPMGAQNISGGLGVFQPTEQLFLQEVSTAASSVQLVY